MNIQTLCHLDEIPDNSGRGFTASTGTSRIDVLVVRRDAAVFAYRNRCPHKWLTLNWRPDDFLDEDRRYIHCANHDALFRIHDGRCVQGPCAGARLVPVDVALTDDGFVQIVVPSMP